MAKHVYIVETRNETGIKTEAYTSLKDVLKSLDIPHLYRTITYYLAKGIPFVYNNITIRRVDAEIKTIDVIYYESLKLELKHGTHRH